MLVITMKEQTGATLYDKEGSVLGRVILIKNKSAGQARVGFIFEKEVVIRRDDEGPKEVPHQKHDLSEK